MTDENKVIIINCLNSLSLEIENKVKKIDEIKFSLELLESTVGRIKDIIETNQDPYQYCKCGHPYFCHTKNECSGDPHSSGNCICNLTLFKS